MNKKPKKEAKSSQQRRGIYWKDVNKEKWEKWFAEQTLKQSKEGK